MAGVIVGVGGMGREAAAWWRSAAESGVAEHLVGFVDDDPRRAGELIDGIPVIGPVSWFDTDADHRAVIGVGSAAVRADLDARLSRRSVDLTTIIHPTAVIGPGVSIGPGSIIGPNVVLTRDVSIGRCAIVNYGAMIGHDGVVEDYAFVGPGAKMGGDVTVRASAWVGIGATVVQGTHIGQAAVVGAGAVVIRDVPAAVTVVGVPAQALLPSAGRDGT